MKYLKFLIPLIIGITASINADLPGDLSQKLSNYLVNYPQEKVYIHFDRDEYYAKEVWFKVCVLDGLTHKRSFLSYIAYVDFFDDKSKLIQQKRIKISGGVGVGSFALPGSIETSMVTVKGYTSWTKASFAK